MTVHALQDTLPFDVVAAFARCLFRKCLCAHVFSRRRFFARSVFGTSSHAQVSSRRRVFARPVFGKCLRTPKCHADLHSTCLLQVSSGSLPGPPRVFAPRKCLRRECVFKCPRVFAEYMSADAQVSAQTILRNLNLRPMSSKCVFNLWGDMCTFPGDRDAYGFTVFGRFSLVTQVQLQAKIG